jgi:hypothetical protein
MNCLRKCCCPQNNEAVEPYPAERSRDSKEVQMTQRTAQLAKEQFGSQLFEERASPPGPQTVTMNDALPHPAKPALLVDPEIVDPEKGISAADALHLNRDALEMAESLDALDMNDAILSVTPDVERVSPHLHLRAPTPPVPAAAASSGVFTFKVDPPVDRPLSPSIKEKLEAFLKTADSNQALHVNRDQLGMAESIAQLDMTDSVQFFDSDAESFSPESRTQPSPRFVQGAAASSMARQERLDIPASLPAVNSTGSIVMIDAEGAETEEHI